MKKNKSVLAIIGLILICLMMVGCKDILISGTFVFVDTFEYSATGDFYFHQVDITDDADWDEHKEKIDFVDAVGVEFFITSSEDGDVTFNAYVDDHSGLPPHPTSTPVTATKVIDDFVIAPGVSKITYKQSLGILTGIDRLKELAKVGMFDYFGEVTGNTGGTFIIDSAKIIVTVSASE